MAERIQLQRSDPRVFFKLDPGEPGTLRSARASETAIRVTAQEQRNLNRLTSEAAREGRRVVFADARFRYGVDGQFASIRSGQTTVRSALGEAGLQTADRAEIARNDRPDADALRSERRGRSSVSNQGNNNADATVAVNEEQRTQGFEPSGQNDGPRAHSQLPIQALRFNPRRLSISQLGEQIEENPALRRTERSQDATQTAEVATHPQQPPHVVAYQLEEPRTQETDRLSNVGAETSQMRRGQQA
jgi:hypothetical protein